VAQPVKERLKYVTERSLPKLREAYEKAPESEDYKEMVESFYKKMRKALESFIEEVLLNKTVVRFQNGISPRMLVEVGITEDDWGKVDDFMAKFSPSLHDQSAEFGETRVKTPDELESEINGFRQYIKTTRENNKARRSSRTASAGGVEARP
jgi:uncharacterized UBP type Zn finger protein